MANVLIDENTMIEIGNAIRLKLGESLTYLPSEMPAKILSITSGTVVVPPSSSLYAHSPNVSDDGTINSTYANNLDYVEVFTIPGAQRLKIEIQYSTESTSYDYICVWQGSHSDYTPSANNSSAVVPDGATSSKIGGGSNATTFTGNAIVYVDGDSVTIGMRTDSSQEYAGYYATITAVAAGTSGGDTPVTPTPTGFEWGSETADAPASWWSSLKTWVANASTTELANCVGKTKKVTLTSSASGFSTTHTVTCIGYNCNRDVSNTSKNTLTFMAVTTDGYCNFSSNMAYNWDQSIIRDRCVEYINAFPGKASVATCSIGYSDWLSASHNGKVNYENRQCFSPSEVEVGISSGQAASYSEFDQNNTSHTPYQYFNSNSAKTSFGQFWFRSMYYANANYRLAMCVSSGTQDAVGNFPSAGTTRVLNYNGSTYCAACFVI